jgi:UDP-glucose 4-epimerase
MTILITGALGHIGSYLLDKGIFSQHTVIAVDNMLTQRYCSLLGLKHRPSLFMESDFSDISDEVLASADIVIHLAAITNAADSFKNVKDIELLNVVKTKEFIDRIARINERCLFIFPSSTSVYGIASEDVIEDDESFLNPQSPYAQSKIEIENHLKNSYPGEYRVLRFGTIFGISKGMRFHTAINKFCYQTALGLPLTIWKENYEQHRPYLGLADASNALRIMTNSIYGSVNGVYNVVSENVKLIDIVDSIRERVDDIQLNFIDTPLLNQYPYKVNFDKIAELGYSHQDRVSHGIDETLKLLGK